MSVFTEDLVPAYSRYAAFDDAAIGDVISTELIHDGLVFTTSNGDMYQESYAGTLSDDAELNVGIVTFGTSARKVLRGTTARWERSQQVLGLGTSTYGDSVDYSTPTNYRGSSADAPGTMSITAGDDENTSTAMALTVGIDEVAYTPATANKSSETWDITLSLVREATAVTTGPKIERWSMHARPQPVRTEEIIVPIVLAGRVSTSGGRGAPVAQDSKDVYDRLRALAASSESITYSEGSRSESVTIEDIEMQPIRYSDDGDWWEGICLARLLTLPA